MSPSSDFAGGDGLLGRGASPTVLDFIRAKYAAGGGVGSSGSAIDAGDGMVDGSEGPAEEHEQGRGALEGEPGKRLRGGDLNAAASLGARLNQCAAAASASGSGSLGFFPSQA